VSLKSCFMFRWASASCSRIHVDPEGCEGIQGFSQEWPRVGAKSRLGWNCDGEWLTSPMNAFIIAC